MNNQVAYWFRLVISVLCFSTLGCAEMTRGRTPTTVTSSTPTTIGAVQRTWYGEKARVAVIEFDDKTGVDYQVSHSMKGTTIRNPIGSGMKDQMVTALMQTNQFIVLERGALKDVMGEQNLGASGRVKRETAAAIGEVEGAEFLIYGAVTEYTPSQASASAGFGVDPIFGSRGAGPGGTLLGVLAGRAAAAVFANQDHVAIDIRLVDARTGRVVSATSVEGTPQDFGGSLGGIFGSVLLGVSAQVQTPMQKAVRACIIKAVNWVADTALEHRQVVAQAAPAPVVSQPEVKKTKVKVSSKKSGALNKKDVKKEEKRPSWGEE
jgi:curli biogenesis system outer membrane secretion channel CsgG